uniref:Putative secreted protein n=1 Tax=Amblyomma americanum TaxID=6943 RepID=A0A0C9SD30_AMBAM
MSIWLTIDQLFIVSHLLLDCLYLQVFLPRSRNAVPIEPFQCSLEKWLIGFPILRVLRLSSHVWEVQPAVMNTANNGFYAPPSENSQYDVLWLSLMFCPFCQVLFRSCL